ncbi:MAG TPA: DUF5666 domain-containing protein [Terracidiphilus sp.]|jgi:hypothetical protein|nr:DUF5666 domain-containing protein [Terracidiphilus sp.]
MKSTFSNTIARLGLTACLLATAAGTAAQAPVGRFVGTVTAINGDTLTVKTDAGAVQQVQVPATAVLKRVEPGQKDLSAAAVIALTDLATGDRVLVRLDPGATGGIAQAAQIITIKQADVAQKQQEEREAWQRGGVGGLVKSVDASSGTILVSSGAGPAARMITVHVSAATVLKRYAPASVRFDLAQPAPISAVQAGDQLRARGAKSADGMMLDAAEVVSGSFRNLSGMIASIDAGNSSFEMKDLMTRKQVTIHITPDAQMHALPEVMARALAASLKDTAPTAGSAPPASAQGGSPNTAAAGGPTHRRGSGDLQQILNRAPAIQFADLKKGDAVMVVATAGSNDLTAISLLNGVEPLLEAPDASRDLLSNWSVGSGGGAAAGADSQ